MDVAQVRRTMARVAELVVARDSRGLARLSGGIRLAEADIREALEEYPFPLAPPPAGWMDALAPTADDLEAARSGMRPQYFADMYLEGEGDPAPWPRLALEILLTEQAGDLCMVEVTGIWVQWQREEDSESPAVVETDSDGGSCPAAARG